MTARRGQNTVEIALLLPILALLVVISADFARAYQVGAAVSSSSRVAAEYAATRGLATPPRSEVIGRAQSELGSLAATSTVTPSWPDDLSAPGAGQWLSVEVRHTFRPITPLAGAVLPLGHEFVSLTQMRRNCAPSTSPVGLCDPVP